MPKDTWPSSRNRRNRGNRRNRAAEAGARRAALPGDKVEAVAGPMYTVRGRSGTFFAYSSMACAIHPAVRATAKIASPAPGIIPATLASVASAKSMFGSGSARRRVSSTTAAATAYRAERGAAFLTRSSRAFARGSGWSEKSPIPGIRSPRRSRSPTTRAASAGSRAAASMVSAPSEAPPYCREVPSAPSPVATTAYGSARTDAAIRAANVDAASS
jgi:hypothetical protein